MGLLAHPDDLLAMTPISGGNTNHIYRCDLAGGAALLLRFFGQGSEVVVDRAREALCFHAVAAHGLCPKLLATFAHGRVEEYVHALPLTAAQFRSPALSAAIARRLRELHAISEVEGLPQPSTALLFPLLREWAALALEKCGAAYEGCDMAGLSQEVDRLEARLSTLASPICLCHNDLNHLNVLLVPPPSHAGDEGEGNIVLVDLEYAGWNHRGFDLGNLLCEWASDFQSPHPEQLDFPRHFPTQEEQRRIARAYLGKEKEDEEEVEVVDALIHEMSEFALASHLMWGIWGLLQSKLSAIQFKYVAYAKQRLAEYRKGMDGV